MTDAWWQNDPVVTAAPASGDSWWKNDPIVGAPKRQGPLSNSGDDNYFSGAAKGLATAAIKGIGNSLGFVGNLGNFTDYLLARAQSKITGRPVDDILAEFKKDDAKLPAWVKATNPRNVLPSGADVSGPILAKTGEYVPTSEPGKIAQAGAEAAFSGVGPGAGSAAATLRDIASGAAGLALGNAAAGAGAQAATDATGDPLLGLAAGLGGAGLAQGAAAAARRVGAPIVAGVPGIENVPGIGSRVAEATDKAAATKLLGRASDPNALRDWARQPGADSEVPGSPRTTAGAVGNDRGLFQAEKDARNTNNLPFNAKDRAQSEAQIGAIRAMQPDGDVFLPGKLIRDRMDALDAAAQEAEDRLNAAHQDAVLGRQQATQDFTNRLQSSADANHARLVQSFQDAQARAERRARDAAAGLGEPVNLEDIGSVLRSSLEEVRRGAKQVHKDLYDAVDPDGTLALVATPVRDKAVAIGSQLRADGSDFDPAEAGLFRRAAALPDVIPYRMLHTLDKDIGAALSKERRGAGETPAWGRLTQLKGAVKDAMIDAADNQARHEARLVDAGLMEPEDTIEGRWGKAIARDRDEFLADQSANAGRAFGANSGTDESFGSSAFRTATGRAGSPRGRPYDAPGGEGVAADAGLQPNFDAAGAQRLRDANSAYADYARTYKNLIVAPGIQTTGYSGQYKMPNAVFIKRAVVPGEKGFEVLNAHLAAVHDNPTAVAAMQNAILDPLRRTAMPTGAIHPNFLARWKENYGPALRALERVAPGFSSHFDDAAKATQALLDLGLQHKQDLAAFENDSAAHVLGLVKERRADDAALNAQSKADAAAGISRARALTKEARATPAGQFAAQGGNRIAPEEVENAVGNLLRTGTSGAIRMRSLVESVSSNPDALAGLRKAGVDWIIRTHMNADGNLAGTKFINFIRDNRPFLAELYPNDQISMFTAIARDAEANARWRTETSIKGGSDTAKNVKPMIEKALDKSNRHISIMSAAVAGLLAGGPKGFATGAALYLLNSLRSAGIRKIDDLYHEALVNPDVARLLIAKMPAAGDGGRLPQLANLLHRTAVVGPLKFRESRKQ